MKDFTALGNSMHISFKNSHQILQSFAINNLKEFSVVLSKNFNIVIENLFLVDAIILVVVSFVQFNFNWLI